MNQNLPAIRQAVIGGVAPEPPEFTAFVFQSDGKDKGGELFAARHFAKPCIPIMPHSCVALSCIQVKELLLVPALLRFIQGCAFYVSVLRGAVPRLSKNLVALLLVFSFIIPNSVVVFASDTLDFNFESYEEVFSQEELEHLEALLDLSVSIEKGDDELLQELFENISPEAKALFLEYLAYDEVMLDTYNEYVDPGFQPEAIFDTTPFNAQSESITAANASVMSNTAILQSLSTLLYGIGLSSKAVAAFLAVASEILATTVVITASVIVAALLAYAAYEIIFGNWSEISSKWTQIKDAFASAFSSKVSSSTMSSAFSSANTTYQTDFITATKNALQGIAGRYNNLECTQAASAMKAFLLSKNQRGELIVLTFPGAYRGMVLCKSYKGGSVPISETGMHQGILLSGSCIR